MSTFSPLLPLKFVFTQHTQSLALLPGAGTCPEPTHPCHPVLHIFSSSPVSAASGALPASLPVYVCAPCPFFTQRRLPQTAVQIETLTSELTLPSSPEQFSVRVACPSGNLAPLSWDPHSWEEGRGTGTCGATDNS